MLKTLRDRGHKVVIFEAGNDLGGTWRWNCYPGAGVDSDVPHYEFSWPEVWKTWNWDSNYPTYKDLRAYFDHVDKVIHIKKDCAFDTVIVGANFEIETGRWNVRTADGRTTKAKYLVLGTGFVSNFIFLPFECILNELYRLPRDISLLGRAWISSMVFSIIPHSGPRMRST